MELASDIGISQDNLIRSKKLAGLPEEYQQLLEGKISADTALTLIDKLSEEQLVLLSILPTAEKFTQAQVQFMPFHT